MFSWRSQMNGCEVYWDYLPLSPTGLFNTVDMGRGGGWKGMGGQRGRRGGLSRRKKTTPWPWRWTIEVTSLQMCGLLWLAHEGGPEGWPHAVISSDTEEQKRSVVFSLILRSCLLSTLRNTRLHSSLSSCCCSTAPESVGSEERSLFPVPIRDWVHGHMEHNSTIKNVEVTSSRWRDINCKLLHGWIENLRTKQHPRVIKNVKWIGSNHSNWEKEI